MLKLQRAANGRLPRASVQTRADTALVEVSCDHRAGKKYL